jgi:hypothetical protein
MSWSATAWTAEDDEAIGPLPSYALAETAGPIFLAAEIEVYRPGAAYAAVDLPWAAAAWAAEAETTTAIEDSSTLRVSDGGWVTRATDPWGVQPYAPILASGVEVDRQMDLTPTGVGAGAGWGSLRLVNDAGALDALARSRNVDGRAVRLRIGRRQPTAHGTWIDPAWVQTAELLAGIGAGWTLDGQELRIALRDPSYWLDRPSDGALYAGAGGLEGGAALAGKRKPRLRGGTAAAPVREIAPVLVDQVAGIYQISDAAGGVVALYERGLSGGIALNAVVADITAAAPPAATYNVESSARGLFLRLGTFPPAGQVTVDAWGGFPNGAAPSSASTVALEMMRQDLAMPPTALDMSSFLGLAAAFPHPAGAWIGPDDDGDAIAEVGRLLRSSCARLVPRRTGRLAAIALAPLAAGAVPVATYTTAQIVACMPRVLGALMSPPPFRMRVGWGRNFTTQAAALAPTLSGARVQELAETWRVATAASTAVLAAWRRPSEPELVETALTSATGAQALADLLRDLWAIPAGRAVYDVTLPLAFALRHDIGEPIVVAYPGMLAAGALGRIVGEQLRTADNLATLQVLV